MENLSDEQLTLLLCQLVGRGGELLEQVSAREELRHYDRVELAVEDFYELDNLGAVPQLDQDLNLLLSYFSGYF